MELSLSDVRSIVAAYLDSEVDTLVLETVGLSIALSRSSGTTLPSPSRAVASPVLQSAPPATAGPDTAVSVPQPAAMDDAPAVSPAAGNYDVTSPTVGVFYRRPAPNEPPFVEVGDDVTESTTVCIIDVMKLFNHVPAGATGRIVEICVADGQLVEHGQTIMRLAV